GSAVADTTGEDTDPVVDEPDTEPDADNTRNALPGRLLGGRFRLEEPLDQPTSNAWRATDLNLRRSVVCQFFPAGDERSPLLLAAAKRAAQVTDARFVRILDFTDTGPEPYVVREFAP